MTPTGRTVGVNNRGRQRDAKEKDEEEPERCWIGSSAA
jgi:hypothetical protein